MDFESFLKNCTNFSRFTSHAIFVLVDFLSIYQEVWGRPVDFVSFPIDVNGCLMDINGFRINLDLLPLDVIYGLHSTSNGFHVVS